MIQRIQTLFLFLSAGAFGGQFFLPFLSNVQAPNATMPPAFYDGMLTVTDNIGMIGLAGLGILLALCAIFLYKNRPLQGQLTTIGLYLGVMSLILAAFGVWRNLGKVPDCQYTIGAGWAMPVLSVIFQYLAMRGIRNDEKIVKSMDRLR
jgi:Domain of unknown function (DUF4293)